LTIKLGNQTIGSFRTTYDYDYDFKIVIVIALKPGMTQKICFRIGANEHRQMALNSKWQRPWTN
jgi:hypothetical protein